MEAGSNRAAIARRLTRVVKEATGRGPEGVRVTVADHAVFVIFHAVASTTEVTLLAAGEGREIDAQRRAMQRALSEPFKRIIEEETGRNIASFMSANDAAADMSCEIFVFEPRDGEPAELSAGE